MYSNCHLRLPSPHARVCTNMTQTIVPVKQRHNLVRLAIVPRPYHLDHLTESSGLHRRRKMNDLI